MVLRLLELKHEGCCSNVKFLLLQLFPRLKVISPNAMEEKKSELLEMYFQFPFILIGKSTMAFLTGQSWRILKSWYTGGGKGGCRTRILALFCKQSLVSFMSQAMYIVTFSEKTSAIFSHVGFKLPTALGYLCQHTL